MRKTDLDAVLVCMLLVSSLLFSSYAANSRAHAATKSEYQDLYTLQESKPLVARAGAWQTWNDRLHIKPGKEKRKLVLIFVNGADGRKQMTDIHVNLSRKPFATIKDFDAAGKLSRNLTGSVASGDIPITVQGFGPSGARLVWKLATQEIIITAVRPNPFRASDKVSVQGRNFSEHAKDIKVLVGDRSVKILSARRGEIQVKMPPDLRGGAHDVVVAIGSVKSNVYRVGAKITPQITWIDVLSSAPSNPVILHGKGFSCTPSDNVVKFGALKAHVKSATETSITCEVPDMDFPRWEVPITVITHGIPSKDHITINIDMRIIPNDHPPPE